MSTTTPMPPVHFYVESGRTFPERILCGTPDRGMNTHVTEYGTQVTCPTCKAILRAADEGRDR
jgi:hypothetical protein